MQQFLASFIANILERAFGSKPNTLLTVTGLVAFVAAGLAAFPPAALPPSYQPWLAAGAGFLGCLAGLLGHGQNAALPAPPAKQMFNLPDPVSDLLGVFFKRALDSKIMQYATLVLEMGIASTIAGLAASGASLLAHQAVAWSIGAGMTASAVAMLCTFQASKNSKGLIISLPDKAVEEKLQTNVTTIERK